MLTDESELDQGTSDMDGQVHRHQRDGDDLGGAPGTDGLENAPWWAKLSARFGIPAAIAIGLTWFLTQGISADLKTIRENTKDTVAAVAQSEEAMRSDHRAISAALDADVQSRSETRRFLQMICVNTAKTDNDRSNCLR